MYLSVISLLHQLRFSARVFLNSPSHTLAILVTLALGIGVTSVASNLLYGALIKPLPYKDANRLVVVWKKNPQFDLTQGQASLPEFNDWAEQNHCFEQMTAFTDIAFNLTEAGVPTRRSGLGVTYNFLPMIGISLHSGRWFRPEENRLGARHVLIISYKLWKEQFESQINVFDKVIKLDDEDYQVVGILPSEFKFFGKEPDLIVPVLHSQENLNRGLQFLTVAAKLKENTTLFFAQTDMNSIANRIEQANPQFNAGVTVTLSLLHEQVVGGTRVSILIVFISALLVLMISCLNVFHLLVARSISREKEFAIRVALGASKLQIAIQLIIESALYATFAGAGGLLIGFWFLSWLQTSKLGNIPRLEELGLGKDIIIATFIISFLTSTACYVASFRKILKPNLAGFLKEGSNNTTTSCRGHQMRTTLAITEVALSFVMLITASLLIRSLHRLSQVKTGFNSSNVTTIQLPVPTSRYEALDQQALVYGQILEKVSTLPGVQASSLASSLPILGNEKYRIFVENKNLSLENITTVRRQAVTPEYFTTLGISLLSGRNFNKADNYNSPVVAVINKTMASRLWATEDSVGKRFKFGSIDSQLPWVTVIGIASDIRQSDISLEPEPHIYTSYFQDPTPNVFLILKANSGIHVAIDAIQNAILDVDKKQPIANVNTMKQILGRSLARYQFNATLSGILAAIATILALSGVYGVIAYNVAQQTREIGIRIALGATPVDIIKMIAKRQLTIILIGVGIGAICSYAAIQLITSQLYDVSTTEFSTFIITSLMMFCGGVLAALFPIYRAVKMDPAKVIQAG